MDSQKFIKASQLNHDYTVRLGVVAELYTREKDEGKRKVLSEIMEDYSSLIKKQNKIIRREMMLERKKNAY